MKNGEFYRHPNSLDVCIHIRSFDATTKEARIDWVNLGFTGEPFFIQLNAKLLLTNAEDWIRIEDPVKFSKERNKR